MRPKRSWLRYINTCPKPHDPFTDLVPPQGVRLTPDHYAYLKISEGCNHRCRLLHHSIPARRSCLTADSRCLAPKPKTLVNAGVNELLVISLDTSAYGVDVKYRTGFVNGRPVKTKLYDLCKELSRTRCVGALALCVSLSERRRHYSADGRG